MSDEDGRAEAERRYSDIDGCPVAITQSQRDAFVAGAAWARESVLAEVRAGIEALPEYRVQAWGGGTIQKVSKTDALAVLDRAAVPGNPETTDRETER